MQTGGVVKTFSGHNGSVNSVSVSADCTMIASGSDDNTACLWVIQTGECHHVINHQESVVHVCFSPLVPQHLISISDWKVQQWDISGYQIEPTFDGCYASFSLDGQLVIRKEEVIEVQGPGSRAITTQIHIAKSDFSPCCFSPDSKLIAATVGCIAYVWDITGSDPQLIETFIDHSEEILSLGFFSSTSLITASIKSIKLWQIDISSIASVMNSQKPLLPTSAPVKSVTLQVKDGIAISGDSDGVVRIWDIVTGICRASFQTPSKNSHWSDAQLINGRFTSVWCTDKEICIWDAEKSQLLRTINAPNLEVWDLRISGDGSMVFCLDEEYIQAWSIWTGEVMGKNYHYMELTYGSFSIVDGLKVWIPFTTKTSIMVGWDFGSSDLSTIMLSNPPPNWPHLNFIGGTRVYRSSLPGIEDTVTRKVVFQLPEGLARPSDAQWDGKYLIAGYDSGEVLILECIYIPH